MLEQHCVKHNTFRPCQECAKEAIWQGEPLIFKRDAKPEVQMESYKVPDDILHAYYHQQHGMALREVLTALEKISQQLTAIYMEIPDVN